MQLLALGINHRSASLVIREQMAISNEKLGSALEWLKDRFVSLLPPLSATSIEVMFLSTCNRSEIYLAIPKDVDIDASLVLQNLSDYLKIDKALISPHAYIFHQEFVVQHAFRVASGLDSMVLGETQILGQVKIAVRSASKVGTMGPLLHRLFEHSFSAAKIVRAKTEIGRHSVSMASAIVKISKSIFDNLTKKKILFVGAGQMIELCLVHFSGQNLLNITLANRDFIRAKCLADRFNAKIIPFNDLSQCLYEFDIIVSCTASDIPIIASATVENALCQRKFCPVLAFDLAVPRDIEPRVACLEGIHLYTVDDLDAIVNANNALRQAAVTQANEIINDRTKQFMSWLESRSAVPTIQYLQKQVENWVVLELEQAKHRLERGVVPSQVLEQFSITLTNKFLNGPRQALNHVHGSDRQNLIESLRLAFQKNDW